MSDSIKYYCLRVLLSKKKNLHDGALDRNTVQFGLSWTCWYRSMASEQPCTQVRNREKLDECIPILLTLSSKYSYTVILNRITHYIFNSLVIVTKVHQLLHFSVVFEESAVVPAKVRSQKWKCWLWGVQETKWQYNFICITGHEKASPFQPIIMIS